MQLTCTACHAPLDAEDVDMQYGIAKCRYCHAVMRFAELADAGNKTQTSPETAKTNERVAVPMPSGIQVEDWGGSLRIVRRWFTPVAFFLVFFCIAWNAFLVFWYTTVLNRDAPWIFIVFPIGHIAVGVGLTYFTLACFLNRTVIKVENGLLSVAHGPLPWLGNKTIDTSQIEQLYCQDKVYRGRRGSTQVTYILSAVTTNGRKVKIVSGLHDAEQALYLEQCLEDHLRIKDRPVKGELPR